MSDPQMSDADAGGAADEFIDVPDTADPMPPAEPTVPLESRKDDTRREAFGSPVSEKDRDIP
ncbi:MAG: hypothetical protein QOG64_2534 [Acidimicrobiaceae bacterium]|jgi:hypothetical protein|nr:hypothetical protein [Acidimicrobiaceae bacterium]